jgi:hypothetical protein
VLARASGRKNRLVHISDDLDDRSEIRFTDQIMFPVLEIQHNKIPFTSVHHFIIRITLINLGKTMIKRPPVLDSARYAQTPKIGQRLGLTRA